jgi:hypothetical protein
VSLSRDNIFELGVNLCELTVTCTEAVSSVVGYKVGTALGILVGNGVGSMVG